MRGKWRSKADIYRYFQYKKQYLLPPYEEANMGKIRHVFSDFNLDFIKDVLKEKKFLIKQDLVKNIMVPHYSEVSI